MFYIYEWYNTVTGEIFYVGKGSKRRYLQISQRNQYFKEYYQNNPCEVRIISYYNSEEEAFAAENKRILELKAVGQCKCNLDNGGTGGVNFVWTKEMKEYKSKFNPMKQQAQKERMSRENPMKNPQIAEKVAKQKQKKVIYKGQETTCKEIAQTTGYVIETIWKWCQRGHDIHGEPCYYVGGAPKSQKITCSKAVLIDGTFFPSLRAAADFLNVKDTSPLCKALKAGKKYKGHDCCYANQQPSDTNSDNSSIKGSETNG